MMETYNK